LLTDDRRQQVEELFRRYGKGVGSYVLARVGGDADVAETITSAVFLTVVRRIDQCRSSPVAWLWSIVRTELARYFRDRKEFQSLDGLPAEPPDGSADAADPGRQAERREDGRRIRRALEQLTDEQQTLVYMKFFLDLPNVEIAESLGMTPGNVGVVAHRAVKRLRELMEGPAQSAQRGRRSAASAADAAPVPAAVATAV
jgi:RNA polymerase sigma-70 factor (ECF subfamily)